jgi:heat shock protein HslJ
MSRSRTWAFALLALAACNDDQDGEQSDASTTVDAAVRDASIDAALPSPLEGRSLVLLSASGLELLPGASVTLGFGRGQATMHAGCNFLSGPYEIKAGALVISPLAETQIACQLELEQQDERLRNFLLAHPTVVIGSQVTLTNGTTTLVFIDRSLSDAGA